MRLDPLSLQIDARRVAATRIVLGISAISVGLHSLRILGGLSQPGSLRLPFLFEVDLTSPVIGALIGTWLVSAVAFTIGWRANLTGRLLFVAMAVTVAVDQQLYSNHAYLLWLLVGLMTLTRPGAAWSVDSRHTRRATVPGWPIVLICAQVSIVYLFAAFTKLNPDFLSGLMLERWLGPSVQWAAGAARAMSATAPIAEAFIGIGLWVPRVRRLAIAAGIAFHASTPIFIVGPLELIEFSAIMVSTYWLFGALGADRLTEPLQPSPPAGSASTVQG